MLAFFFWLCKKREKNVKKCEKNREIKVKKIVKKR
jgi:hypothetical protein